MNYTYDFDYINNEGEEYSSLTYENLQEARENIARLKKEGAIITRKYRYINNEYKGSF